MQNEIFKGWRDDLTNEQYHNDNVYVSSSPLKLLIEESADVFHDRFVLGNSKPSTEAMSLSTLVHHAVNETEDFKKRYVVKPKFDLRTNIGKAGNKEWMEEHKDKIIVTMEDLQTVEGTYESIFKHPDASLLLKNCQFEKSGYYTDPDTGIPCRIRYDAWDRSSQILIDLKAVRSVQPAAFSYAIKDYRWDLSMAMYGQGIFEIDGDLPEDYVFIAVEKTRPYRCAVYYLGKRSLEAGYSDYRKALATLKTCRDNGKYPGIQERMELIELPNKFLEERNL